MDIASYERRLNANTIGEALVNSSVDIINATFESNPAYEKVKYEGEEKDCIYKLHKYKSDTVYLTFRPYSEIFKGDYVEFRDKTYFVIEFIQNDIYPKAEIVYCNNTLRWKDSFDTIFEFPCAISGNTLVLDDAKYSNNNRFVLRSDATLYVKIPYNDSTKTIYPTQRFVINNKVFDVTTINDIDVIDGKGYLELALTSTAKSTTDDLEENIADSSGNSGWSGW